MKVAALYDVHGNIRALEAVLAEVPGDAGDYPFEWPSSSRDEAVSFFEARAVGS